MKYTIDRTTRDSIPVCDKAKDYLAAVGRTFKKVDKAENGNYLRLLTNTQYDGVSGVREHILKMTSYHKKLKDMDVNLPDDYLVFQILESLPPQFGNLRIQYNTQRDTWNIAELTAYVAQEEKSLKKGKSHTIMMATIQESGSVKKGSSKGSNKFFKKKKFGKKTSRGNSSTTFGSTSESFKGKCHFCKKPGHKRAECRRFKAWLEKKGIPVAFVCFESNLVDVPSDTWWLDTGATINITNSLHEFRSRREPNERELIVHMGNGVTTKVESIGVGRLHLATGYFLDLLDTAYTHSIRRNLIFVSILDRCGYNRKVYLFRNSKLVGSDTLYDGLYMIDLFSHGVESSSNAHVVHVVSSNRARLDENSSMLWHKRLGHISKQRMERLIKDDILHNLDFSDFGTCVDCIKGKLTAKTRKERTRRSQQVLEMVHTDICGPFIPIAIGGYKYFITFIDDFSRYGHVELLTEKSESLSVFQAFKANVELQKGKKIKAVRSDKGGEYYGRYNETGRNPGPFAKFLQECGIKAQYTMPGTPEHNGIVERRNRTLLDIVRCMLSNSTLSNFLWGEALKTTAYILNQDDHNGGSSESRSLTLREERMVLLIPSFPTSAMRLSHIDVSSVDPELHHDMEPMTIEDDVTDVQLRRSERIRRPAIPDDYVVYLQEHEFDADSSSDHITFQEAISCSESSSWIHAMHDEMAFMYHNRVERYKAKLVAKGFSQREGIDYTETDSLVFTKDSFRIIMALVAHFNLELHQMDVKTTFLNGSLSEDVYMVQPNGFVETGKENMSCAPRKAPISKGDKISKSQCPDNDVDKARMQTISYASIVDSLMYAQVCTRPNIVFPVGVLGRYLSNLGYEHWKAAKKVLRYLQATKDFVLTYQQSNYLNIVGYSDADFARFLEDKKSTSGYIFIMTGGAILWKSAKQTLIASSTMEAEYVVCFEATRQAL
ncbi:Integrase catalytic domain-containing protein [Citrus sinensis]|nr:Integrase catalytic domain-containing protein [Citrus sinensis]